MSNKVKQTLKEYNLKPKKYFGQNFLINKRILEEIVQVADLKSSDVVLEIGAGLGNLTKRLAKKVKKVVAIEKDRRLVRILKERLSDFTNIKIVEGDILISTTDHLQLGTNYKIVANLPYYITSPIIRKFLEYENPPKLMVLMVQKEVAERICAKPPKMSLLSVAVQFYSRPEIVKIVKKDFFWPKPKVDSAILRIVPLKITDLFVNYQGVNKKLFFEIVKAGFSQPRKQIKNNLKKVFKERVETVLKQSKIDKTCRAETLSVNEWRKTCLNYQNTLKYFKMRN